MEENMAASDAAQTNEQDGLILDSVERFLDRDVKPYVHALEHDDIYPAEIVERMKELGLFGATIAHRIWRARPVDRAPTRRSSSASRRCGCRWPASSTRI